jgi:hypothetical protein
MTGSRGLRPDKVLSTISKLNVQRSQRSVHELVAPMDLI